MATFFVYAGVEVVVAQWSFTLLTLHRGESVATGGLLVGLFWGSLMVGRVLFGVVADRVPLTRTLTACLATSVVGALLFWLEPTRALLFLGLMLIGASVVVLTVGLLALYRVVVGWGRWGGVAVGGR
jgi:fucose permease